MERSVGGRQGGDFVPSYEAMVNSISPIIIILMVCFMILITVFLIGSVLGKYILGIFKMPKEELTPKVIVLRIMAFVFVYGIPVVVVSTSLSIAIVLIMQMAYFTFS